MASTGMYCKDIEANDGITSLNRNGVLINENEPKPPLPLENQTSFLSVSIKNDLNILVVRVCDSMPETEGSRIRDAYRIHHLG